MASRIYVRNSPSEAWTAVPFDDAKKISSSLYIYASGCTGLTEPQDEQPVEVQG